MHLQRLTIQKRKIRKQSLLQQFFYRIWYQDASTWQVILMPLALVFWCVSRFNRLLFLLGLRTVYLPNVPTLVVGNIHVGGSGKSPVVRALYDYFHTQGYQVGIVSRGYLREPGTDCQLVGEGTAVAEVGDEAYLLFAQTGAPTAVGKNRARAVQLLLGAHPEIDLIISDDGLQHHGLGRDLEVVLLPGVDKEQNKHLLPRGPLRESIGRLKSADFVLRPSDHYELSQPLSLIQGEPFSLWADAAVSSPISVNAVAGIAHPDRFFRALEARGFVVKKHAFADHHSFALADFDFDQGEKPLLMTEKDAVKCQGFARPNWYKVPLALKLDVNISDAILKKLLEKGEKRLGRV